MPFEIAAPDQPLARETQGVGVAIQRRKQRMTRSLAVTQRVARLSSTAGRSPDHQPIDPECRFQSFVEPVQVWPARAHEFRLEVLPVVVVPSARVRARSLVDDRAVAVEQSARYIEREVLRYRERADRQALPRLDADAFQPTTERTVAELDPVGGAPALGSELADAIGLCQ